MLRLLCFPVKYDKHPQVDSFLVNLYSLVFSPVFLYVIDVECMQSLPCDLIARPLAWCLEILLCQQSALQWSSGQVCWEANCSLLLRVLKVLWPQASEWAGGPRDRLGPVSCKTPESSPWLPTDWIQPLKWQWTSPPSQPLCLNDSGSLHGSHSVEATATEVYGHCH